jgi:photosystem II stability/assembly factor-like uncharacterized protein
VLLLATAPATAQTPFPPEALHDAELTSIVFVDADTGWAVGDRGVIWHTIDGGRHWQRQDSPVRCRLAAVSFVDPMNGWAVGGSHRSYTHQSEGVVLRTVDAGKTWQNVPSLQLPALKYVKFFDARRGVAVGESSPLFPAGVYLTQDGGRSWATSPTAQKQHWHAADFLDPRNGVVASLDGKTGVVGASELNGSALPTGSQRRPQAVRLGGGSVWLCGEGSLLLQSRDGGASWSAPPAPLPVEAARQFDFAALATHGQNCWVAGTPGSLVFHSPDGGQSWQAYRTDSFAPINSLFFLDENRGWAVGALGTILATRDGGRSWRVQRQGGQRAALLTLVSEAERLPHEIIVQQAGNEGYLTAVEVLTRPEMTARESDLTQFDRLRATTSSLLASHVANAWQFPTSKLDETATLEQRLAKWDATNGGQTLSILEEHLVGRIRMWRPDVIVTEDAHPSGNNPLAHLTNQLVLSAVQKAADPAAYRDHLAHAALPEWKVQKVFATITSEKQGDIKLVCSQLAPRIGASLVEVADEARSQLESTYTLAPPTRSFSLLIDHLPQGQGRRDFFSGIAISPGSDARRSLSNPPNPDFASLSKQIQKRQMMQGLLERSEQDSLRGSAWLAQVNEMTRGLSPASSGRILYHLAQRYQASGEQELAAEVMTSLVEKHPEHPLSDAALLWLIHYYASGETALRLKGQPQFVEPAAATGELNSASAVRPASAAQPISDRVAITPEVAVAPLEPSPRAERALALGQLLEKRRPTLATDPAVRFALATAARRQMNSAAAERYLQGVAAAGSGDAWQLSAKSEQWIANPADTHCPKKNFLCAAGKEKPKLDGRLDDAIWQAAKPVSLHDAASGVEPLHSIVAVTHDEEFLYLAVSCQRAPGVAYKADDRPRPRDADLSANDRVEILLDIDRDYATYHRLVVDHRGWTCESSCGDRSWDPTWYVAAAGDDAYWTVEAAIPLAELCPSMPKKKTYWAVGLQRIVPAQRFQSWTEPADLDIMPAGFGLMQFE